MELTEWLEKNKEN